MVRAIGSSAFAYGVATATSVTGLEAQYDRLKSQLTDWECCSSAKTPEGKAKIREISDKVREVETRLEKVKDAKPTRQPVSLNADATSKVSTRIESDQLRVTGKATIEPISTPDSEKRAVGSHLNVFA